MDFPRDLSDFTALNPSRLTEARYDGFQLDFGSLFKRPESIAYFDAEGYYVPISVRWQWIISFLTTYTACRAVGKLEESVCLRDAYT